MIRVAGRAQPLRVFEPLAAGGDDDRLALRDRYEAALAAYRARGDWDAVFDVKKPAEE